MGTSAIIHVQGVPEVCVYKHFDGMPERTLPWLEWFNKEFSKKRGDDPSYKFAQLLRSSIRNAKRVGLDKSEQTGWGVYPSRDMSGNFEYTLLKDGRVIVK